MKLFTWFIFVCLVAFTNGTLVISKDIQWTVNNGNGTISVPAKVPGGIYSDLRKAGLIGSILYRFNDVMTRWVAYDAWTYTGRFNVTDEELKHNVANLVLHGVDTIAFIELNDDAIGSTNNMFVRYVFDVKQHLKVGQNELKIKFAPPVEAAKIRSDRHFTAPDCVPDVYHGECHANQLRKMQASFSWDWGPAFPSVGLWKLAAFELYNTASIRTVTTHTEKIDQHWHLKIKTYVESNSIINTWEGQIRADLKVDGNQKITVAKYAQTSIKDDGTGEIDLNMTISENVISPWWPNGYGEQNLYELKITISSEDSWNENHFKKLNIGFRTLEVIEENASLVLGDETAGKGLTFYFKVNGYPIFMKGSNWIPAHILPELGGDKKTIDDLLLAAREAHMAMLRVWGGGVYESDYFYQRCDELGILIWQDFLFACSMYPVDTEFLDTVRIEIEQNVKRLQYHPSIAIWAGNNENEVALRGNWYNTQPQFDKYKEEYIKLYVDTIKPIVEEIDPGRRYLVSSPSNGLESEQEGYISENPYDPHYGDTHYYNYVADNWDANIYPKTRFASEYGFQSLPSLFTMKTATNSADDFHLDSEYSKHRQHSPNGYDYIEAQMSKHFDLNKNDSMYFQKFVYYSQIFQAMAMKTETEFYRQSQDDWYTMGALYWQLNDVWQAPSWSGIEFGSKWKMLHYYAKSFFAPVLVSPRLLLSGNVDVYLINDRFVPIIDAQIVVDVYNWSSLIPVKSHTYPASVGPLTAKKQDIVIDLWDNENKDEIFLKFTLKADEVSSSPYNFIFPKPLKTVKGLKEPHIQITVLNPAIGKPGKPFIYPVNIRVDTVVLFLWLDVSQDDIVLDGRFEENGFIVTNPHLRVNYISKKHLNAKDLEKWITYQYYTH